MCCKTKINDYEAGKKWMACSSHHLIYSAYAQVTITGVITDNKSRPIPGVSISIKDSYDGATTDSSGKYSFKTYDKGEQLLLASSIGYRPFEQRIKLEGNTDP